MVRTIFGFLGLASLAAASYDSNLNYRSPSLRHPELGLSKAKVLKRHAPDTFYDPASLNFTHGVASGDPYDDSVILWTRVSPTMKNDDSNTTVSGLVELYSHENDAFVQVSAHKICVEWKIATDTEFKCVADKGTVHTSSDIDYTIKVEANHLKPFTTYYYQFNVCGSNNKSPIGRTKTIPREDKFENITLAVYSCSNLPFGFFNAYGSPLRHGNVDYIIHLGDYIYEYANGEYGWGNDYNPPRIPQPDRILTTLYDYRTRIAQYRTDLDLYQSHQNFAWITVWDDHEVADNSWKASSSYMNNTEDSFELYGDVGFDQRKANAVRAYFEWMPLRQISMDDNLRIWRNFRIGKTLDLTMLDTRHYDRDITDLYWNTKYVKDISEDQGRSIMGPQQEKWFYSQLDASEKRGASWRVIGNQIIFSKLNQSFAYGSETPLDYDAWDGYQANRNRVLNHLYTKKINNTIFLAGDSHANWATDVTWLGEKAYNSTTGVGSIGVEFAGTAVSSPCPYGQNITIDKANFASALLVDINPELQWSELYYRGYYELTLTPKKATARYYGFPSLRTRNSEEYLLATFEVNHGENKLARNPTVGGGVVANGYIRGGKTVPPKK